MRLLPVTVAVFGLFFIKGVGAVDIVDILWDEAKAVGLFGTEYRGHASNAGGWPDELEDDDTTLYRLDITNERFITQAAKLGIEVTIGYKETTRGYANQDAYFCELFVARREGNLRPIFSVFGVLDGHGQHGDALAEMGVESAIDTMRNLFRRIDSLPDIRHKTQRLEFMKRNMKELIGHASAHVDGFIQGSRSAAESGSTMTVVLWDFEGNFMVTGSLGDSPAYAKTKNKQTQKSDVKILFTDQGMDSLSERKRTAKHLRDHYGLVPVAKETTVSDFTENGRVLFGPRTKVKSYRTSRWKMDPTNFQWLPLNESPSRIRKLVALQAFQQELAPERAQPKPMPPGLTMFGNPFQPQRFMDVVEGYDAAAVARLETPFFGFTGQSNNVDFRFSYCQVSTSLGHRAPHLDPADNFRIREPVVTVVDLEGLELEYIIVASDGLTTPLFSEQWAKAVQQPSAFPENPPASVGVTMKTYRDWIRGTQILSRAFEESYDRISNRCSRQMLRDLDTRISALAKQPATEGEGHGLAQYLVDLAVSVSAVSLPNIPLDDITVLAIRPGALFKPFGSQ